MHHVHRDLKVYGGIKLFAGTGSPDLAQKIADYLDQPVSSREVIEFPNENLFVKLNGSVRGQDVYVIQTTSSPVHRNLMELLIMIQTLRLDSAARITAVIPYLCYGRSDKKDQPRVPITARLVADMLEVAGADRYMTLDPHAGQVQGFFSIPGDVLTASHLLVDHINNNMRSQMKDPVVVSVDLGFAKKGRNYAADMDMPIAFIEKRRHGNDAKAEALTLIGDVKDRDVIIVDDEVDTGGSISQAVNVVKQNGARDVYLAFVHAILSRNGAERLASLPIKHIITTDSAPLTPEKWKFLESRTTVLSVAQLLGEVIRRAHEGRSVGEMFNE
ncbi:MAG TPA: ribose-phosphate diphosphokinase [Anaerolineales bacterium]|nr:ribose-phosphate diphosphokinase [Anaerolineales bacterium]HMV94892.1 ribose-phosphate diphosphokinase [Anaerolineales bacterium]HMX19192.1 ribose-phosphate diphosphokinase [Anaerolineales bacterium]HMX75807.1 ribose-phosphate diphosphokinase [Anaerolineales bacterium]HMZ43725.1 ribose-phosphate diphosphokinase [Anaerolineales bacterium]